MVSPVGRRIGIKMEVMSPRFRSHIRKLAVNLTEVTKKSYGLYLFFILGALILFMKNSCYPLLRKGVMQVKIIYYK